MPLDPSRLEGIELQRPMSRRTMAALTNVANVNASPSPILRVGTHSSRRKPHRIPLPFPRQSRTTLRVAKIAELPQFFLRWGLTFMSRRRALPAPPASQRKPPRMQPIPVLQLFHRHEKWTSHQPPSAERKILKCYGLFILLISADPIQSRRTDPEAKARFVVTSSQLRTEN